MIERDSNLESLKGIRTPDGGTLRVANVNPTREFHKLRKLYDLGLSLLSIKRIELD